MNDVAPPTIEARERTVRNRTVKEKLPMSKPRISYVDPANVKDQAMLAEFDRCAQEGTPRPESQAIRAHVPAVFWSFANEHHQILTGSDADQCQAAVAGGGVRAIGSSRALRDG
jgi:hypothetical protein